MFDDVGFWSDIGCEVVNGELKVGHEVTLARRHDSSPNVFREQLRSDDAVQFQYFATESEQIKWVAQQIKTNLTDDELDSKDILVIFANPVTAATDAGSLIATLGEMGVPAHVAGVTSSASEFFVSKSVAISGIYRAKGNEAPMVYFAGADYCQSGRSDADLVRRRNILFTAITRSKAWIRVCGVGTAMRFLMEEWNQIKANDFKMTFVVPDPNELTARRRLQRDRSEAEQIQRDGFSRKLKELLDDAKESGINVGDLNDDVKREHEEWIRSGAWSEN
ncbi:MAG: ATP-binding domain-containing protein [Planctomycetia bacterium]